MASKYLLEMSDYDGDNSWYEFDNDEWWDVLTTSKTEVVLPDELIKKYEEMIGDDPYESYWQDREQFFAYALEDFYVGDREKYDTYVGVAHGRWY